MAIHHQSITSAICAHAALSSSSIYNLLICHSSATLFLTDSEFLIDPSLGKVKVNLSIFILASLSRKKHSKYFLCPKLRAFHYYTNN